MNAEGRSFRHSELTRKIIGVFFQVYSELGYGFLESVYRSAMTVALRDAGLLVEPEVELHAGFRGRSGLLNYLRCTIIEIGLLLNFGPSAKVRRLVFANQRKHPSFPQSR
jgi:hypothetical protein